VTDHYDRVARDTKKRVIGCLLGSRIGNVVNITNSFAVPFDEEERPPLTWFLDHNYLEDMAYMFRRVNQSERIVGWYSTGPKLKSIDIDVHKLFYEYNNEPVCCIIRVGGESEDLPTNAYVGVDVIQPDGRHEKEFAHIQSKMTTSEAEEVGVEHLLREIQDISLSTLTMEVNRKLTSIHGLNERLNMITRYLESVIKGNLPINQDILNNLQLIFNLAPNLSKISLIQSFAIKKNDTMLNIYISSLLRSILALDHLLENKLENKRRVL